MRHRIIIVLLLVVAVSALAQRLHYPAILKTDVVDTYHGTLVADPYRWLEDDTSAAVARWVKEENDITFSYLDKIPYRKQIKERLEKIYNYERYSVPWREGKYYLYYKNTGLQNQSVLYRQTGLQGKSEVLIDPNALSDDGTTRLGTIAVSNDSKYLAYSLSKAGSDWQEIHVKILSTNNDLPDVIHWVKVSGIAWLGNGFFYSRYDAPEASGKAFSAKNENHKVYFHTVGTDQKDDKLIYEDSKHPQRFHFCGTTDDERFVILTISDRGTGKDGNALYAKDLKKNETEFKPIVDSFDFQISVIDNIGDKLLVQTNTDAPNDKVALIDPAKPSIKEWKTILPEQKEALVSASFVGGKIFAKYLKDVTHRVYVYDQQGRFENEINLPTLGTAGGFNGRAKDAEVFFSFTSFTFPPMIYRYMVKKQRFELFKTSSVSFTSSDYETKQIFYQSKDGTQIPMFIVHRKGIAMNGKNPTLLYGYGGFNISLNPNFNPLLIPWLEQGGIYAVANIRGGGEYGEKWHRAGMQLKKQNVFDDFIAAAEWLIANSYTSPSFLGIEGGSNGGLLVGAVTNQRPELFKVALPAVGVMDMLRFHKFTIGWNWIPDYGSSDDSVQFTYLKTYSPLHNITDSTKYPAVLVTTADHDDRVVPAHSFKYIATLQEKNIGNCPVLIRIETRSGHGASSTTKRIEENADILSFLMFNLGMQPKY